jgi:GntR family transcriptional regulator
MPILSNVPLTGKTPLLYFCSHLGECEWLLRSTCLRCVLVLSNPPVVQTRVLPMFLRIEKGSAVPISRQIVQQIGMLCASGQLDAGERLPSVRELARELAVNQNTILRVYERLTSAGLLEMRHGQGTFVTPGAKDELIAAHRERLIDELRQLGRQSLALGLSSDELHSLLTIALEQLSAAASPSETDASREESTP